MTLIGIQGGKGSTNEEAAVFFARKYRWKNPRIHYLISTENVLSALDSGKIQFGTFAWESSIAGRVEETREAIKHFTFQKVDEVILPVDHALLINIPIDTEKNILVFSHPHAIRAHSPFLEREFLRVTFHNEVDTAVAARKLKNGEYPPNSLVIAPKNCAEIYGLQVFPVQLTANKEYKTTIYLVRK